VNTGTDDFSNVTENDLKNVNNNVNVNDKMIFLVNGEEMC